VPGQACQGGPAADLFDHALCLCGDMLDAGAIHLFESGHPASVTVGINGDAALANLSVIDGSLAVGGNFRAAGALGIAANLSAMGDVAVGGVLHVGGDLDVGGRLTGAGLLGVGGTLRSNGGKIFLGLAGVHARGPYVPPHGPPCGCDAASRFDVAGAVNHARNNNDNAHIGLTGTGAGGPHAVTLPSGHFYMSALPAAPVTVTGAAALYLDAAPRGQAPRIMVNPGATIDLYVAGDIDLDDLFEVNDAQAVRIFAATTTSIMLPLVGTFRGSLYAPAATVIYTGNTQVEGALFAETLAGAGLLTVDFHPPMGCP
jgi:hypothetical protein